MFIYTWIDPQDSNNYLTVESNGRINYYYASSFNKKEGAYDPGAVLRACRAWKAWVKQNPGQYWCAPARPELERFYSKLFPDVKIRKQQYSWWKLLVYPIIVFTLFTVGLATLNNVYINSLPDDAVQID